MALPALAFALRGLATSVRTLSRTAMRSARTLDGPNSVYDTAARITPIRHTQINIHGLPEVSAALRQLAREEVNIAIAAALNRTSLAIERKEKMALSRDLDRPTPFTLNSVARYKADRNRLSAKVFVRPIQSKYLETMVRGGRLPTVLTPINVNLDRHGNIRGKKKGLAGIRGSSRKKFIANINGTLGVWQRHGPKGRKLRLLVQVDRNQRRDPRWDFYGIAERTAQERLRNDMRDTLADALATTVERGRWR